MWNVNTIIRIESRETQKAITAFNPNTIIRIESTLVLLLFQQGSSEEYNNKN